MRAHLLLTPFLLATAGMLASARAEERAPLPEAVKILLQEDRFAKRVEIPDATNRSDAYRLQIRPGNRRPPYDGLDADEIGWLIKALQGVKIVELDYTADPDLLPLLGKLPGIEHLYVRGESESIDGALRELLPLLPDLDDLQIQVQRLGNPGLKEIARHPKIRSLFVSSEKIDDEGVRHLRNMRQLRTLHVNEWGSRSISDAVFAVFAELSQLEDLSVSSQGITGSELAQLARLEKLKHLSLAATGVTDDSLRNLAGCTHLRSLMLGQTPITDRGIPALADLKELEALYLNNTPITDEAIAKLAELPNLEALMVASTSLSDAACGPMSKLPKLKVLSMPYTYVTDTGVAALTDCKALTGLQLIGCGLTDRCVGDLCKLKSLTHLSVEQTEMTPAGVQALRDGLGERCSIESGGPRNPDRQGLPKPRPVRTRRPT